MLKTCDPRRHPPTTSVSTKHINTQNLIPNLETPTLFFFLLSCKSWCNVGRGEEREGEMKGKEEGKERHTCIALHRIP